MVFNHYRRMAAARAEIVEGEQGFPVYNEDIEKKAIPPAVDRLANDIRGTGGVIFFTPEYNYSVPGGLKNTIDWLSRLPEQPFQGKPVAIVSASPGRLGGARMQYHLRQIGVFLDMRFLNRPEIMISEAHKKFDSEGRLIDETTAKLLQAHLNEFLNFIDQCHRQAKAS